MVRIERNLSRVSAWFGPPGLWASHVQYRDPEKKLTYVNDGLLVFVNNFLLQGKDPSPMVRVTVEWD
jgi:hypothetical protein